MEQYISIILSALELALLASVIATNVINGLKNAIGIDNTIFIRLLTAFVDTLLSYWVYFEVARQKGYLTFAIVTICCYAGAEAIYKMMGSLTESKEKAKTVQTLEVEDIKEVG